MNEQKPTKEEVEKCIGVLNDIMVFVANRGIYNKPVPEVIKTLLWLKDQFGIVDPRRAEKEKLLKELKNG